MDVIASAVVASGDLVKVGGKIVVAAGDAAIGSTFVGVTNGVYRVPKEAGAVTQGAALYFKASTKTVTTSATGNTLAGYAFSSADSGDATVDMFLVDNTNAGTIGAIIAGNVATVAVADGVAVTAANGSAVETADATDLPTAQALANANKTAVNVLVTLANANKTAVNAAIALANNNKVKINAMLTALKAAGIMTADAK